MTKKEFVNWNNKADFGTVADDQNPAFILRNTSTELLIQIAKGEINMQELAKRTLEDCGRDINGKWVGYGKDIK